MDCKLNKDVFFSFVHPWIWPKVIEWPEMRTNSKKLVQENQSWNRNIASVTCVVVNTRELLQIQFTAVHFLSRVCTKLKTADKNHTFVYFLFIYLYARHTFSAAHCQYIFFSDFSRYQWLSNALKEL